MKWDIKTMVLAGVICAVAFTGICDGVFAQGSNGALKPYIASMEQFQVGMSFWQMIKAGGSVMIVLIALSIVTVAIIVYIFITVTEKKLTPNDFSDGIIQKLDDGDEKAVKKMCTQEDNIISRIVSAGMAKKKRGALFAKEAMENCAKKEIGVLWQNISYLADIAAVAPLIGLLGTVVGMIQAFNVIAFQTAVVKPMLLAGGVSKAMVTTAAGLIVAIPTLLFYAYFRGRVQQISNIVENYSSDIIKLIVEAK